MNAFECDACGNEFGLDQKNSDGYGNCCCNACMKEWKENEPQEWKESPLYDGCFDDDDNCDDVVDDHHADQEYDYWRLTR